MLDMEAVKRIVDHVTADRLAGASVIETRVRRKLGWDGDPILRVGIVFDDSKDRPSVALTVPFTRHLWHALDDAGEAAFPVVSYVGLSELPEFDAPWDPHADDDDVDAAE